MIIDLCGRTRIKQRKAFDDGCIEGNAAAQWLVGCKLFSGRYVPLMLLGD